jgi:hypothetical protein
MTINPIDLVNGSYVKYPDIILPLGGDGTWDSSWAYFKSIVTSGST